MSFSSILFDHFIPFAYDIIYKLVIFVQKIISLLLVTIRDESRSQWS